MGLVIIDLRDAFLTDSTRLVQVISVNATELLCEDAVTETVELVHVADVGTKWLRVIPTVDP